MARTRKLTPEQEKEIKLLQASNEMLERTKEEAKLRGKKDSVKRIEIAQKDVISQMNLIDSDVVDEYKKKKEEENELSFNRDEDKSIFDILDREEKKNNMNKVNESFKSDSIDLTSPSVVDVSDTAYNNVDSDVQYDVIPLPSHGEGYKNKLDRVPVAYLTAYDENFITSPNLYNDGLVIDFLLKNKIMNKDINVGELYRGDVDAIILWLRATSYGADFPISVVDPQSGQEIETTVDLTKIKPKEFTLKGDAEGYFSFELPVSKDIVKFKFLTRKEERNLELLSNLENKAIRSYMVKNSVKTLRNALKSENTLSNKEKVEINQYLNTIDNWANKANESDEVSFNRMITNRMEMSIVEVNGNRDREYIRGYIRNMIARDSLMLRRYMVDNEPGLDFEVEVERPQSLGGGSFKTFLEWDDSVFLNIS